MIVLLVILAGVGALALIGTSISSIEDVLPSDLTRRGRWGVFERGGRRRRPLDAHERRWQTRLISARNQSTRWPDLVTEIRHLEHIAELSSDPTPPDDYDVAWVEARLAALEHHLDLSTGEPQ